MSQLLVGHDGRLILVGDKPLAAVPGVPPTTGIKLTPFYTVTVNGVATRFNIQTTAASGDTTADVPFVFTYTGGNPVAVWAKVVDSNSTDVVGWTDITSSVHTDGAGTGLGYLSGVPDGVGYRRQVRVGASGTVIDLDTAQFNVGTNVLPWGQSNMGNTLDGNIDLNKAIPGTASTEIIYYNGNGTAACFTYEGFVPLGSNGHYCGNLNLVVGGLLSLTRLLGTTLQNKRGRKVGIAISPWAVYSSAMTVFVDASGGSRMIDYTATSGNTIGYSSPPQIAGGQYGMDYRIVTWHEGESQPSGITRPLQTADLKRFCKAHLAHVAKFNRPANKLTFLFAIMGVGDPPQMEILRGAVLDLMNDPEAIAGGWDVRIGWNCIDLDPANNGDTLHFGGVDKTRSLYRMTQGAMHVLDPVAVPYGAAGPRLTGAVSRSGDVITLTVAHEGGSGLAAKTSGSLITGWYANTAADFSGTDIALTNVTIFSATQIQVTATGAPATFYIKHCGGKYYTAQSYSPNVSNLIYDNFVYPTGANAAEQFTGLPLQPTPDAIKVGP